MLHPITPIQLHDRLCDHRCALNRVDDEKSLPRKGIDPLCKRFTCHECGIPEIPDAVLLILRQRGTKRVVNQIWHSPGSGCRNLLNRPESVERTRRKNPMAIPLVSEAVDPFPCNRQKMRRQCGVCFINKNSTSRQFMQPPEGRWPV